jgi:tRNA(Ile)-lysidine synthase
MIADAIRRFFAELDIRGPIVAAVSGGVDSTALLVALMEVEIKFSAAHINHHLRGAESDDDEAYVRELCARYDVPLRVADGALDPHAIRDRGVEAAAREVRHLRLRELAGDSLIATAHQKNDQAETVLMRLMTGGGIAALRGIHPVRDDGIIRPLLAVTRHDIEQFLEARNATPRFDRSNADPRFLRNRIRALLREFDASVIDNLAAAADQARQQWPVLEAAIDAVEDVVETEEESRFRSMPEDPWLRQALLLRQIRRLDPEARDVSAADLARLATTIKRTSVTKSLELLRDGTDLVLRRREKRRSDSPVRRGGNAEGRTGESDLRSSTPPFEVEIDAGQDVFIPEIAATIHIRRAPRPTANQQIQLPSGALPHFTIRNRREGDRFQPLGMARDKKLKDLLIDRKIPAASRDRIPLVLWEQTIAWVAGIEVSELFKVTDEAADRYEVAIEQDHESVQRQRD